jgi:hypothetical protein
MSVSPINDAKNSAAVTNESKTGNTRTWDESTASWNEEGGTWDAPGLTPATNDAKNNTTVINENKT